MAERTLTKVSVQIHYRTNTGSSSQAGYTHGTAKENLVAAIDELARLAALCGWAEEAKAAVADACKRVEEWEKTQ